MMSEPVRVNFSKRIALFPLPGVVLLPHAVAPLHIFEPRYRQMVRDCLDQMDDENLHTAGKIAMATFDQTDEKVGEWDDSPGLRPAVCVGHIVKHEPCPDGRCHILVQGICRANILEVDEPEGGRLYRVGRLDPTEDISSEPPALPGIRERIRELLDRPRLRRMCAANAVLDWLTREEVPTHALIELVGFAMVNNDSARYQLLAEASPHRRAKLIQHELTDLDKLIHQADQQSWKNWPKGMSWN